MSRQAWRREQSPERPRRCIRVRVRVSLTAKRLPRLAVADAGALATPPRHLSPGLDANHCLTLNAIDRAAETPLPQRPPMCAPDVGTIFRTATKASTVR
jgi:hypothetical protein